MKCICVVPCTTEADDSDGMCGVCRVIWDIGGECHPPIVPTVYAPLQPWAPMSKTMIDAAFDHVAERELGI